MCIYEEIGCDVRSQSFSQSSELSVRTEQPERVENHCVCADVSLITSLLPWVCGLKLVTSVAVFPMVCLF